jgi:cytochrome c oxidase assembly protein subunit 15
MQSDAIIEYLHRFVAALTSPFILLAAILGWRNSRSIQWVSGPPLLAVVFLIAVVGFGALAVLRGIPPAVAALDLGSALIVLALMLTAMVIAYSRRDNPDLPDRLAFQSPYAKLTLWAAGAVFLVLVSGVLVADSGSIMRCLGWPLYNEPAMLVDLNDWLQMTRRLLGGVAGLLVLAVVVQAWRTQRDQVAILRVAAILGALFVVEIAVGVLLTTAGISVLLLVVNVATASALWAAVVVLTVLAGLAAATSSDKDRRPV